MVLDPLKAYLTVGTDELVTRGLYHSVKTNRCHEVLIILNNFYFLGHLEKL